MKEILLNSKYCKNIGYWFKENVPIDIEQKNYLDNGIAFKFGFTNSQSKYVFDIPEIRTVQNSHTIYTFRDLGFKIGDEVVIDKDVWFIEDISFSYFHTTQFKTIKQWFMVIK